VPEQVHRLADVAQDRPVVGVEDLRPHHADAIDPLGRFDQRSDGARREDRVVAHHQDVVGPGGSVRPQGGGDGPSEPLSLREADHPLVAQRGPQEVRRAIR
jgi:hypothetical protein